MTSSHQNVKYNGVKGPYGYCHGRAEGYARVPGGPSEEAAASPGDCSGEGKAQMKRPVSAYLVACMPYPTAWGTNRMRCTGRMQQERGVGVDLQSTGRIFPRRI
jgi:hypothetical protein